MRRVRRVLKVDMERATSRLRVRSVARARVEDEDRLWGLLCAVLDPCCRVYRSVTRGGWRGDTEKEAWRSFSFLLAVTFEKPAFQPSRWLASLCNFLLRRRWLLEIESTD